MHFGYQGYHIIFNCYFFQKLWNLKFKQCPFVSLSRKNLFQIRCISIFSFLRMSKLWFQKGLTWHLGIHRGKASMGFKIHFVNLQKCLQCHWYGTHVCPSFQRFHVQHCEPHGEIVVKDLCFWSLPTQLNSRCLCNVWRFRHRIVLNDFYCKAVWVINYAFIDDFRRFCSSLCHFLGSALTKISLKSRATGVEVWNMMSPCSTN